ncbi:hypothetical protein AHAS_Ahas19G0146400 [Arachis hypogaea]
MKQSCKVINIAFGVKKINHEIIGVYYKRNYPYAASYCHKTKTTIAFMMPLEDANGSRVKVAVYHIDASQWNASATCNPL